MRSLRALFLVNVVPALVVPLILLSVLLLGEVERSVESDFDRSLSHTLSIAALSLSELQGPALQSRITAMGEATGAHLTVFALDGVTLADSHGASGTPESGPEVAQARGGARGVDQRRHFSRMQPGGPLTRYLAGRESRAGADRIYRVGMSAEPLGRLKLRLQTTVIVGIVVILLVGAVVMMQIAARLLVPVEALAQAAARFAGGDADARVLPDGPAEVNRLGRVYNSLVDQLNSQIRRLDEAQSHLDAVLSQMPEGLLVTDARGVVSQANVAAERLLAMPSTRILNRPLLGILLNYTLDGELRRALVGEVPSAVDVATPDGRSLRVTVGALQGRGRVTGAVVLLQDLSELHRADAMRRDFVANVSHELRTPVASIRAMVETIILRSQRRPELLEEYGHRIVAECVRMDALVGDLLVLAESESGRLRLDLRPLDLHDLCLEVAAQVEVVARETGTSLTLGRFVPALAVGDRAAMVQCVRNLVDNALRYAPGSEVRIGSRLDGDKVVLQVADGGPGIAQEDLPRIFERFYRADKARNREGSGTGLGLSIVRHLVEAQGGRVWVESRHGQGATFFVALPGAPEQDHLATAASELT